MQTSTFTAVLAGAALLGLAGCTDETIGADPTWMLGGSVTAERTNADLEDLRQRVEARGGEFFLMESFPEQFSARGMTASACQALHDELSALDYIADVRNCGVDAAA